jgi:glucan biosynthesis protein C
MQPNLERHHALDGLRAAMMFLGVVIHAACGYATLRDIWWFYDGQNSRIYDFLLLFLHTFRLPVFFVMAGFFAALLHERRGAAGALRNRAARILVPLVVAQITLYPLMRYLDWLCVQMRNHRPDAFARAANFILSGEFLLRFFPMHLWFLEYLYLWCLLGLLLAPLLPRLDGVFRAAWRSPLRVVWFALPTAVTLLFHDMGLLNTPHGFMPELKILAAYGVYFVTGWLLWWQRELLDCLRRGWWLWLALSLPLGLWNAAAVGKHLAWTIVTGALLAWLLIFGLTGLFLRHLSRPSKTLRYLSDSSYWVYLVHPPVLVVLQLLLYPLGWSAHIKFVLVLAASLPVLIASYHWLVRPTWLGAALNGRRYPRQGSQRSSSALNQSSSEAAVTPATAASIE